MNQDEALQQWLKTRPLGIHGPDRPSDQIESVARTAWHAAINHTLEHVADTLDWLNHDLSPSRGKYGTHIYEIADLVRKLKP